MEGTITANPSAAFIVTIKAPESLQWDALVAPALQSLQHAQVTETERTSVIRHYAYLLRLHSWKHSIDWDAPSNKITVSIPNQHAARQTVEENGLLRDGLTTILKQVFGEVSLEAVLSHFENKRDINLY